MKSIKVFSLIYMLPQLIVFCFQDISRSLGFYLLIYSVIFYTLVLIVASMQLIENWESKAKYLLPIKIILLSFLFFVIACSLWSLRGFSVTTYFGDVPRIINGLIVSGVLSLLPLSIAMLNLLFNRNKKEG